jgi:hypothetical protein
MIPFVAASFRGGGGRKPSEVHSRFGPFRLRVGWFCMANQNGRESDRDYSTSPQHDAPVGRVQRMIWKMVMISVGS